MRAVHMRTDYLKEPVGLGNPTPRLYWKCEGGVAQSAYQVIAEKDGEQIWDSGKVSSSSSTHIPYGGPHPGSRERIDWKVRLWDEKDEPGEWSGSFFEMGLLLAGDWKAKWISGNYRPKKNTRYPVDCFRKTFTAGKRVKRAVLYMSACGLYRGWIDGKPVSDAVFMPGATDYRKRIPYQTYDVTELLRKEEGESGSHTLDIWLADGWYRGSIGCFGPTNVFGRQTKLLCQMEITYENGGREMVLSDGSFSWSNDGPIRFADLEDGEIVDASMTPSYSGKAMETKEEVVPTAGDNVLPKEKERFTAKLLTTPSGKKVLDFGQNLAGYLEFRVKGAKGQQIRLTCGEILDENGEFTQKNMTVEKPANEFGKIKEMMLVTGMKKDWKEEMQLSPKQQITFLCSGKEDVYHSMFCIFGFRYALVETDLAIVPEDFTSIAVYSDMEQTGTFSCSLPLVNQLVHNTLWSMKSNYLDVPTDCPTRERMGWTGDAQIFFDTGAYFMDIAAFFRKWLWDMEDNQFKDGKISAVIPYNGASMIYDNTGGSVGWCDAAILIPWRYYQRYGDREILERFYGMMKKNAMFMIKNAGPKDRKTLAGDPDQKYIYEKGMHLGEWLEPEEFQEKISAGNMPGHPEECIAYLHYTLGIMAQISDLLGKEDDAALFAEYSEGAKRAYRKLFFGSGAPDTDRQAKLVRPLALGLCEGSDVKEQVQKRLAQAVVNRDYTIATGFLSTPFVLGELTKMGRADLAYRMLENEKQPGWLYEVKQGATTIWENWEGSASHNHYSPGAVCQWLFDTVAGIVPDGENHFVIRPVPGGDMTWAEASYDSLYGRVESSWRLEDGADGTDGTGKISYHIVIPSNVTAEVCLPDRQPVHLTAGEYTL